MTTNENATATIRVFPTDRDWINKLLKKRRLSNRKAVVADVVHELLMSKKKPGLAATVPGSNSHPNHHEGNET